MIVTDVVRLEEQAALSTAMRRALDFLRRAQTQKMADGTIEIDGDRVYAVVQSYETLESSEWTFEGHRKYIDLQYIAASEEIIGWASLEHATITAPYDESKDVWLGTVPPSAITPVRLSAGQVAVFYPADAHAPKHSAGAPKRVKKIVVKVALD